MQLQRESFADFIDEALPLLQAHYEEVAKYKDIPLSVDVEMYLKLEEVGTLRIFTAREEGGLIGYAVYFVRYNPHYSTSLQAVQDVLFLAKGERRGLAGYKLIKYADERLAEEGVEVVYHHVKLRQDFGPLLERLGYEPIETIWGRRL